MDAKITKKRLGLLLSYDWIKIVGICVAAVLVWCLLFTTFGTRPSNGQNFEMYLYPGVRVNDSVSEDTFHAKDENGALSYDILDFSTYSLTDDAMDTVMQTHFAAGQGDALVAAALDPTRNEDTNEITAYNGIDNFVSRYYGYIVWLDPDLGVEKHVITNASGETLAEIPNYFYECARYLNQFYNGDWKNGELDEQAVRANFDERMQGDKRFKNEAQREIGRQKEIERIQNLRDAFENVQRWAASEDENSPLRIRTSELSLVLEDGAEAQSVEWNFAFDLSNIDELTEFMSYPDENGTGTKDGLCMSILRIGSMGEEDLSYEPITLLNYLVKEYAPEKYEKY